MAGAKKKKDILVGRSPEMQLYRGVRRYVQSRGGSILVIGGIQVQEWPGEPKGVYHIAVKVLGRKPDVLAAPPSQEAGTP